MTLHLHDPEAPPQPPSCGNCQHFRRHDPADTRIIAGAGSPDGHCGLRNPSKREGLTRWCRETDWCDQWQAGEGAS